VKTYVEEALLTSNRGEKNNHNTEQRLTDNTYCNVLLGLSSEPVLNFLFIE